MEGTIAEIRLFAGNFAPRNWAFCQGQILSISQNTALFSLLGTTYGGNGQTTFALPDFRGRVAVGTGQGPGLSNVTLGEVSGTETNTLLVTNLPAHTHNMVATSADANSSKPAGKVLANSGTTPIYNTPSDGTQMGPTGPTGGNQPFSIMQPYLGMNYIICLFGIFPSRN
ncbi:MAG TPA: tail fiber protein [Pyrinomonadaceae bacterium]|nr:tail fiber protein [Pyrinomonadaceae bacterium]